MSDLSSFLSTRNKQWTAKLWDGFIEGVQARLAPLEEQLDIQKEVADAIVARGLTVIEQELAPIVAQADQILDESTASINAKLARFEQKVTGGTVISMSNTSATLSNSATINLTVIPTDREFFAPTPFLAISRASTVANWAIAKVNSFNRLTGALSVTLEQVNGAGGPYSDWIITSLPGATLLQKEYYEQTLALRAQVAADKEATGEDRAAALTHRNAANDAAAASIAARNGSTQAYADMRQAIAPPLTPPVAPVVGQIWWDGLVVRVFDGVGFVPTVTASIGGLRFDEGSFPAGTDGKITIAGGFRFVMLWLNGALLYESRGDFLSATPDITIPSATEGDEWKYWAYQAIDATDYDTKEQVNDKITTALVPVAAALAKRVRFDADQTLSQAEKGVARANLGLDAIGEYRNKIINGDFEVSQRGVTFPFAVGTGSGSYTIDRWRYSGTHVGAAVTISRLVMPPGYDGLPQYVRRYLRFSRTTTGTSHNAVQTRIEGARTLAGKRVTLTVYLRGTPGKNITVELAQAFGSGGNPSASVFRNAVAALTGVFVRHDFIFDLPALPSDTVFGTNGDDRLEVSFLLGTAEGNCQFDIAHISLVEGDASKETDPFSPRHIQQELALCQRYYQPLHSAARFIATAAGQFGHAPLNWPAMRTNPTSSVIEAGNVNNASSISLDNANTQGGRITITAAAAGDCYAIARIYGLDAEL